MAKVYHSLPTKIQSLLEAPLIVMFPPMLQVLPTLPLDNRILARIKIIIVQVCYKLSLNIVRSVKKEKII